MEVHPASRDATDVYRFRSEQGNEVDAVLETRRGHVICIEVNARVTAVPLSVQWT